MLHIVEVFVVLARRREAVSVTFTMIDYAPQFAQGDRLVAAILFSYLLPAVGSRCASLFAALK